MAIRFYDEALFNKIYKMMKDKDVKVYKPDEVSRLFQVTADIKNDGPITLPMVSISRDADVEVLYTNKKSLSFDGLHIASANNKTVRLCAIPVELTYQIDIYTKQFDEGDDYLREFIFTFVNNPKLVVELPYYGFKIKQVANLKLMSTVTDNSAVPEKLFADQFTRWSLRLRLEDAYIYAPMIDEDAKILDAELDVVTELGQDEVYIEVEKDII